MLWLAVIMIVLSILSIVGAGQQYWGQENSIIAEGTERSHSLYDHLIVLLMLVLGIACVVVAMFRLFYRAEERI